MLLLQQRETTNEGDDDDSALDALARYMGAADRCQPTQQSIDEQITARQ